MGQKKNQPAELEKLAQSDESKGYRPGKEILELFYVLADLDKNKRHSGIVSLLNELKNDEKAIDYVVERLVTGLASSRAAARVGFSTTFSLLLESITTKWSADRLFDLADKKISLKDKTAKNANAIGHHLLAALLIQSGLYSEKYPKILEREMFLYRNYNFLAIPIVLAIADMVNAVDTKTFKTKLLTPLKDYIEGAIHNSSPEFLLLILLTRKNHAIIIHEYVAFLQKDGTCKFEANHLESFSASLKKCDRNVVKLFIHHILEAAESGDQFDIVYKTIIERWASSGNEPKVLEWLFSVAELALQSNTDDKNIISIFSDVLMKRITNSVTGKKTPQQRVLQAKVVTFCNYIDERLSNIQDSKVLLEIVNHLDNKGSFDKLTKGKVVEKLISRLDKSAVLKWIQGLKNTDVRRIGQVFNNWSHEIKEAVLVQLVSCEPSEDLLMTVANAIDSLYYIKVRAGERVVIKLSEENQTLMKAVAEAISNKEVRKNIKSFTSPNLKLPLSTLWMNTKIWEHFTLDVNDKKAYSEALQEIQMIANSEDENNISILIDLLISLLSRPHKFIRLTVAFVYVELLPTIKSAEVQHIVESLMMDDVDIEEDDELSSDMDDGQIDEKEEDDESEEQDSEEEDMGDVNPELVSRLEQALGDAAVKRKDNGEYESDVSLSDMDDQAMFAMDEKLANIFKTMTPRQEKAQKAVAIHEFRSKVADLLLFTVSSSETPEEVKIDLIMPLLDLCIVQLKRNTEGTLTNRVIGLLDMLAKQKKMTAKEKKVKKLMNYLIQQAPNLTSPLLNSTIASLTSFLFSLGISEEGVSPDVKAVFIDIFNKFLTQEEGNLSSELGTAAIIKYPMYFVSEITMFIEAGFNDEFRIFRRMEALQCVIAILNKSILKTNPLDKSTAKKIGKTCDKYLNSVIASPSEVKPRFFTTVLKLLNVSSSSLTGSPKEALENYIVPVLESMVENEQLWKDLKKVNSVSAQIFGKQPLPIVKNILKNFQQ